MKSFVTGCVGALLAIALALFTFAQYSDYRGRAETEGMLAELEPFKQSIEAAATKNKSFVGIDKVVGKPTTLPAYVDLLEVTDAGEIFIRGGRDGQLVILLPTFVAEKVVWRCIGSPAKDMPGACKKV